jgi:hypothetical protein
MTDAWWSVSGMGLVIMETFINNEIPGYVVQVYVDNLCRV